MISYSMGTNKECVCGTNKECVWSNECLGTQQTGAEHTQRKHVIELTEAKNMNSMNNGTHCSCVCFYD